MWVCMCGGGCEFCTSVFECVCVQVSMCLYDTSVCMCVHECVQIFVVPISHVLRQAVATGSPDEESCDRSYEYVALSRKSSEALVRHSAVCVCVCVCVCGWVGVCVCVCVCVCV